MFRMRTLLFMLSIVPLVEASGRRCSYFNGDRMPCSQLDRARKFNKEKMPKLRAAGYDKSSQRNDGVWSLWKDADVNWDVGTCVSDPDKSTKTDDEDMVGTVRSRKSRQQGSRPLPSELCRSQAFWRHRRAPKNKMPQNAVQPKLLATDQSCVDDMWLIITATESPL